MNVIKQVAIVAWNASRSYMVQYIIEHMYNSNVIVLRLVDHVSFLCKMPMDEWNATMAFHLSIDG